MEVGNLNVHQKLKAMTFDEIEAMDKKAEYYGFGKDLFVLYDVDHKDYLRKSYLGRLEFTKKKTKPNVTLQKALDAIRYGGPWPEIDWSRHGRTSFEDSVRAAEDKHGYNREKQIWFSKTGVKNCKNLARFGEHQHDIIGVKHWQHVLGPKCPYLKEPLTSLKISPDSAHGIWIHSESSDPSKGSGYGKTSFAIALLHDYRTNHKKTAKAVNWKDFCNVYDRRFGDGDKDVASGDQAINEMRKVSLLLLDEMPKSLTEAKQSVLFDILDDRINKADNRKTIFTSNYSFETFHNNLTNPGLMRRLKTAATSVGHITKTSCRIYSSEYVSQSAKPSNPQTNIEKNNHHNSALDDYM